MVKHFFYSGLVQEKDCPAFESAVQQASRLRDSLLAEVLIVGLVIVNVIFNRVEYLGSSFDLATTGFRSRTNTDFRRMVVSARWYSILPVFARALALEVSHLVSFSPEPVEDGPSTHSDSP